MIACVSPTEGDVTETLNTLRYANRAKNMQKPPIPKHLQAFSAKKRKFANLNLPKTPYHKTPGKYLKLNNTLGPSTPVPIIKSTPKFNSTVSGSIPKFSIPKFSDSLNNLSEEDISEISSIPSSSSKASNMTLIDASCLSPLLRKVIAEHEDKLIERLQQTLKINSPRRSPRLLKKDGNFKNGHPTTNDNSFFDETLIQGPAFSSGRRKLRENIDNLNEDDEENTFTNDDKQHDTTTTTPVSMENTIVKKRSVLQDVTNTAKKRRKSAHKENVEKSASPVLCRNSLEEKEEEEVRSTKPNAHLAAKTRTTDRVCSCSFFTVGRKVVSE